MEVITHKPSPDLTNLASEAKTLEGDQKFMEPGTTKKKRGRPSKEERAKKVQEQAASAKTDTSKTGQDQTVSTPPPIPSKEIAKPFCQLISKAGASYVEDPRAQMTPEELENVATAMGMVMDKWMPMLSTQYGAELYLIVALGSWGSRLYAFKKLKNMEKKEREQKEQMAKMHDQPPQTEDIKPSAFGSVTDLKTVDPIPVTPVVPDHVN